MNNITIRPAHGADHEKAASLMQQVQELHIAWRPDIYKPCDEVLPRDEFLCTAANGKIIIAEADGEVAGLLLYTLRHIESEKQVTRDVLFIDTMVVDEKHRGKGIGHQLFDHIRDIAKELRCDGIELQVNARNAAAFEMYKKYGFTEKSINMELL